MTLGAGKLGNASVLIPPVVSIRNEDIDNGKQGNNSNGNNASIPLSLGAIVGIALAGIAFVALLTLGLFFDIFGCLAGSHVFDCLGIALWIPNSYPPPMPRP